MPLLIALFISRFFEATSAARRPFLTKSEQNPVAGGADEALGTDHTGHTARACKIELLHSGGLESMLKALIRCLHLSKSLRGCVGAYWCHGAVGERMHVGAGCVRAFTQPCSYRRGAGAI